MRARLIGCKSIRPLSILQHAVANTGPRQLHDHVGRPASNATPIRRSSIPARRSSARRREPSDRRVGDPRWTCAGLVRAVIAHLPANCENGCFLVLAAPAAGCQDGAHGVGGDDERAAIPRGCAHRPVAERRGRLLAVGLDLLSSAQQDMSALTMLGICRRAGLAARYFYERFADKNGFVSAVFDWVLADLAATTQAAVAAAPPREQTRTGMANIVRTIGGDVGRLLFSAQPAYWLTGTRRSAAVIGTAWASLFSNSFVQQANSRVMPSGSWK